MSLKSEITIGLTMGDPNGIGPEVLIRALQFFHPFREWTPLIFGDIEVITEMNNILGAPFSYISITSDQSRPQEKSNNDFCIPVIDLTVRNNRKWVLGSCTSWGGESAFQYVYNAIQWANNKKIDAIVTAPLSKEALQSAGYNFPGHTELLSHYSSGARPVMMLAVDDLRATMVTLHMSLRQALDTLTPELILEVMEITDAGLRRMGIQNPRLGIAGLNPHAGENRLFGDEEYNIILPAMELARKNNLHCVGPFPPDTVFLEHRKGLFDAVVAHYHDQALIPLKLYGFDRAVNITLGLPIIRTSPDHGTAFQLAPQIKANPSSMIEAIKVAVKMNETAHSATTLLS
ncbi:MAG: D-threonate 4-phosphate dehydrogenase [Deltaproteobacteria bacterium]|jgi:4-hydroxythreonine-4-phosphate dehydrogenase|nr:D-threonate 4-phosphate dehydrogenase [Deltaproteobacteria bacterium]